MLNLTKVLIVGSGPFARELGLALRHNSAGRFELVGFIGEDGDGLGTSGNDSRILGTPNQIPSIVESYNIKKVIMTLSERRGKLPFMPLLACRMRGIEVVDGLSFYERITGKILLEELKPGWLIFSEGFDRRRITLLVKRTLDLLCAAMVLILTAPLLLLIPLLIRWDSPGPALYRQQRIGEGGRPFTLLKFRSMVAHAEATSPPVWAKQNDARITRLGQLLRRFRLDELPQIINVFRGDMSFIGPRPDIPYLRTQLEDRISYYALRYTVKPGITGWAQIHSSYVSNLEEGIRRHQYDLYYIKNMALTLDLKILLQTLKIVFTGRGAR